ncbi:MAG: DUF47 family protein [Pedosphaera sp.]|nr:DUF47 family protein [Pedosphaera sp.]
MFSLQKLVSGGDNRFYELLTSSAEEGHASVQSLKRILTNPSVTPMLDEFVASRRRDKVITNEITELLCRSAFTSLEREDIESLSISLYRIPKTVEKFAERYVLSSPRLRDVRFDRQIELLEQATQTLLTMVRELHQKFHLDKVQEQNELLQKIEGEADKLMLELLRDLYCGNQEPIKVIILKDLYELLEKVVDRCRDTGNVVAQIVLKNS